MQTLRNKQNKDFSLVIPNGTVSADPGEDVILPVHLSPETSAVSMDIRWYRGTELIHQYKNQQEISNDNYEQRLSLSIQELERGNLSLTLRNVQQSDSEIYTCKIIHDGCLQTGVVHLQVTELQKRKHTWRQTQTDESSFQDIKDAKKRKYNKGKISMLETLVNIKGHKTTGEWELDKTFLHTSGPTPRRRNSIGGDRPLMSDVVTPLSPITVEPMGAAPPVLSWGPPPLPEPISTILSISPVRTTAQENPGAKRTQEQESESTEQERFSLVSDVVTLQRTIRLEPSGIVQVWGWDLHPAEPFLTISPISPVRTTAQENPGATRTQEQESESSEQESESTEQE